MSTVEGQCNIYLEGFQNCSGSGLLCASHSLHLYGCPSLYYYGIWGVRGLASDNSLLVQGLKMKGAHIQRTTSKKLHPYLDLK